MKHLFSFSVLSMFISILTAQDKKPMGHEVYEGWKENSGIFISPDGNYAGYEINPQEGDGVACIYSVKQQTTDTLARVSNLKVFPGSRFIAGEIKPPVDSVRAAKKVKKKKDEMPKDSLIIFEPGKGTFSKYDNIRTWKIAEEKSPWLVLHQNYIPAPGKEADTNALKIEDNHSDSTAYEKKYAKLAKQYKPANLILINPYTKKTFTYENVVSFDISKNGNRIVFDQLKHDTIPHSIIYTFDPGNEILDTVFNQYGIVPLLCLDDSGSQIAFAHAVDTSLISGYSLFYWKEGYSESISLIDSSFEGFFKSWGINKNKNLSFSNDGNRIFMGTSSVLKPEKNDSLLEEEKPHLDIWTWQDPYIQPMQKVMLPKEKIKTYLAIYDLDKNAFMQLADTIMDEVVTMYEGNGPYMLGFETQKYASLVSWEGSLSGDVYLINASNGEKELIIEKTASRPVLSPFGKYVVFYDKEDSAWYSYNTTTQKTINLTSGIEVAFYDELNDVPQSASAYGMAGFTRDDEYLLVYDKYDIWKIDPSGNKNPFNLTGGKGRQTEIRYRYLNLDPKEYYIEPKESIYLSSFNLENMKQGFVRLSSLDKPVIEPLVYSENSYSSLMKAKDKKVFLFRKSDFRNYPDLYLCTQNFKNSKQISNTNPQSKEFLWGDVRLVDWISGSGEKLKGLLYTPENLNVQKKYPLLIYFYERSSETLYSHRIPSASRSIISIPWCTSNGYVVFVPDISYKVGYPGQSAFDAVVSGTNVMARKYNFIDSTRMGLQGQSWGGYQIAWLITRTNMFRAAMAGAPVTNMTSAYGGIRWATGMSRMYQYEKTQSRIGATLWENPGLYMENSPLFYAPDVETPLLIMHNDADGAVPWYQGIEYYMALRRLNKKVWMLSYNNEAHNLTKWPNRVDLSKRMMGFFDYYLKDEQMPLWMKEGIPAIEKEFGGKY